MADHFIQNHGCLMSEIFQTTINLYYCGTISNTIKVPGTNLDFSTPEMVSNSAVGK